LTLSDKIAADGRDKAMAGQTVRVVDIEADGGTGHGIFTSLPEGMDGRTLSVQLTEAARQFYGTPLRAFLEKLAEEKDKAVDLVSTSTRDFLAAHCPSEASGQVKRVCGNFGFIAAAGELVIQYGVLPWPEGTAQAAAVQCFKRWIDQRGGIGNMEVEYALERIKTFFQKYRDTRFRGLRSSENEKPVYNPAGYVWYESGEWLYLVEPSIFHEEIRKGVSRKMLVDELLKRGWLARNRYGRLMETKTIPDRGNVRGYIFVPRKWEDASD
jgi:putative DNA primase/helicase